MGKSTSKDQPMIDILLQDVQHLQRVIGDVDLRVQKFYRVFDANGHDARVQDLRDREELMGLVEDNTKAVQGMVNLMLDQTKEVEVDIFRKRKLDRRNQTRKNLEQARYLSSLAPSVVRGSTCPCGKHRALRLKEGKDIILEGICPVEYWKMLSRVAYEDGRLSEFTKENPLDKFTSKARL